ncbi:hypothetical protein J5N97_014970 [Dioscorea zingiberensis]|uniref:DUF674 family protein n=1 Tax=Dioscorea zingiberensis TaxID=325984 RepID=A0A9D5CTS2_9LILI|nr:hypothetical protein J5N97_014970 [Dioscorea zingiberensis]
MSSVSKRLFVELLVDKERNRVVFAESDKDFVDVLLSFLTLPLGTVVRLLDKRSSLGAIDELYSSVESLDPVYLHSIPCKSMLLRPRSAAWAHCKKLAINLDDSDPEVFYRCRTWSNCSARTCCISPYPNCLCSCGQVMDTMITVFPKGEEDEGDGVFVNGVTRFMIGDDLQVRPVSMAESLMLFENLGIRNANDLEKRTVLVGIDEILKLLERSLVSKMPLTDVFLHNADKINSRGESIIEIREHQRTCIQSKRINLKLFLSNESSKVVYAESGEDFVNLLFSFLTFPLGLIVKVLNKQSCMGSIDNLYESVELLCSVNSDYMKSEECMNMLLAPKLPPYFGCASQLLKIDEMSPQKHRIRFNGVPLDKLEMNPRYLSSGLENGGFVKGLVAFMVTDEMSVTPLSPISGVHIINKMMLPISCLEEAKASIGEAEVLNLLKACLNSPKPLSDVLSPNLLTVFEEKWSGLPNHSLAL